VGPRYDFRYVLDQLKADEEMGSPLARLVGAKGYHAGEVRTGDATSQSIGVVARRVQPRL
jgi:hypothetical protein